MRSIIAALVVASLAAFAVPALADDVDVPAGQSVLRKFG